MKNLAKYLKPYAFLAILSPIIMIGEVMGDLILPKLMSWLVDYGVLGDPVPDTGTAALVLKLLHIDGSEKMAVIITFGVLMLLVTLVGGTLGTLCAWTAAKASQNFGNDLRRDAYRRVMSLSIEQTDKFTTGSLVTRMTNDIAQLVDFVESIIRHFVRAPIFLLGGIIMLLTLNLSFGAVLICSLPVLIVMLVIIVKKAVPLFSVVQEKLDRVNSVVQENIGGARVIKAYSREEYECERFEKANTDMKDTSLTVMLILTWINPILTVIMALATVAIIYIGGLQVRLGNEGMTVGNIMAGTSYVTRVISSIMMITMMFQSVSRATASAKRINEILASDPVIAGGTETAGVRTDDIVEFRNVSFSYPGTVGREVLKNISLTVKRGETLAVIGATGSGKTSLVQMIPRFYDCTEGTVIVDGMPVEKYSLKALRKKIGYVMQKTELFSDTAENNIKWGKGDASDEEVVSAARTAQAEEFINTLPAGYKDFIAEKGASLSGGQKQRMSIARALVRRPEILILDDSTSALDLATEAKLQKALKEKLGGTTVIMIAQRIASVRECDRIAVIEADGTIKHCAPHDELMKISETYRDIYSSQVKSGAIM